MSKIEWTGETWNVTTGCTRASAGCDNCYAVTMTKRLAAMGQAKYQGLVGNGHFNGILQTHESELLKPFRRKKPTIYFVNSMSDLFHKAVPFEFIDKVFAVMGLCPQHTFQVLTKRPERMAEYLSDRWKGCGVSHMSSWGTWCSDMANWACDFGLREWGEGDLGESDNDRVYDELLSASVKGFLRNVWLGTSVENQEAADQRIPDLLRCPAAVRFLSCEPLIGPVDFNTDGGWLIPWDQSDGIFGPDQWNERFVCDSGHSSRAYLKSECEGRNICLAPNCHASVYPAKPGIDWVIVGGESGHNARPYDLAWPASIIDQCREAGVSCFHKQLGSCPVATPVPGYTTGIAKLKDKKGGDPAEWPEDLRVRQFPEVAR